MLTAAYLRERLDYEPDTGLFRWKPRTGAGSEKWNSSHVGAVCGSKNGKGYIYIRLDGRLYRAHRLAWLYVFGAFPKFEIDHIDRCRDNNRIANLRDVPSVVNVFNRTVPPSASGLDGIKCYRGKTKTTWYAYFRKIHLGSFATAEAAMAARSAAVGSFIALTSEAGS